MLINSPTGFVIDSERKYSFINYYKAECETFRKKELAFSYFEGQMGNGIEEIREPFSPDWKEPYNQFGNDVYSMAVKVACGDEELGLLSMYKLDSRIVVGLGILLKYAESCDASAHLIFDKLMSKFEITQKDFLAMPESSAGYMEGDQMGCFNMEVMLKDSQIGFGFL